MGNIRLRLEKFGVEIPEILLPQGIDLKQWAVIACDQFTQDRSYWEKAREAAGGSPSALHLIFSEAFLGDVGRAERIADIHRTMREYIKDSVFTSRRGFVYIERDTPFNRGRRGLVAAVDLERYDWSPDARPLIRATEGTVAERLPPRMDIRRNAPLETTHVILLINDETDTLLRDLGERAKKNSPVYQGELMLNSGEINGWFLDAQDDWNYLASGLEELTRNDIDPFLFAVGDGNHSLACAKRIWEEYKAQCVADQANTVTTNNSGSLPIHPCRYALVEIENIYDPAIRFEPIHRVVFGLGFDETLKLLSVLPDFYCREPVGREEMARLVAGNNCLDDADTVAGPVMGNRFGIVSGDRYALVETGAGGIATALLQPLLDRAVNGNSTLSVDYIHGEDELFRLAGAPDGQATGILLPSVQKTDLFKAVARYGPLPRKSFSMGEAEEKRFYVECRKLFD